MLHVNEKLSERDINPNFSKNFEVTYIGAIHILRNTLRRVGEIQILRHITGRRGSPNMLQLCV